MEKVTTDEHDEDARRNELSRGRRKELNDLRKILSLPEGVRFFRRVMEEGKVFQTTFTGNSHTFFLEGKRSMALWMVREIFEADPLKMKDVAIFEDEKKELSDG